MYVVKEYGKNGAVTLKRYVMDYQVPSGSIALRRNKTFIKRG